MTQNANPTTGVRYGVIACNSLNQDLVHTLFYGSQATNVSEEEAAAEAETGLREQYQDLVHQARVAAEESGADREDGFDREAYEECWFEEHSHDYDEDWFIEKGIEDGMRDFQIEEPTITGTHEGVAYQIGWLGGAAILWVVQGPTGNASSLCSPCVPNAANLDSGFALDTELEGGPEWAEIGVSEFDHDNGFPCYCVPRDWLDKEPT